ncbi:hypothetical protein [Aureimonas sp. Leaf454]|uniref:hypothetical protein n=1 Tax=Aureimonas sp. Leaf454 TaxID=1736381 RepID=UPI00138EDEDF|nr:hypothetical protein [Aureimonas sp. Leaf454]
MAVENCSDDSGLTCDAENVRRRHRLLSCVDWRGNFPGVGPNTEVRWVLSRDRQEIAWLNFREVEDGPWILGNDAEVAEFQRHLLSDHPHFLVYDERPGFTTGSVFPEWVHTFHIQRADDRWEFVR